MHVCLRHAAYIRTRRCLQASRVFVCACACVCVCVCVYICICICIYICIYMCRVTILAGVPRYPCIYLRTIYQQRPECFLMQRSFRNLTHLSRLPGMLKLDSKWQGAARSSFLAVLHVRGSGKTTLLLALLGEAPGSRCSAAVSGCWGLVRFLSTRSFRNTKVSTRTASIP